jgi:hypothetical protein
MSGWVLTKTPAAEKLQEFFFLGVVYVGRFGIQVYARRLRRPLYSNYVSNPPSSTS